MYVSLLFVQCYMGQYSPSVHPAHDALKSTIIIIIIIYLLFEHFRIRIPYNCVELIFGMVHPSTFERLKTQLVSFNSWSNVSTLGTFF